MPFGLPDHLFDFFTGRINTPSPTFDAARGVYDTITKSAGSLPPPPGFDLNNSGYGAVGQSPLVPRGTLTTPVATLETAPRTSLPPPDSGDSSTSTAMRPRMVNPRPISPEASSSTLPPPVNPDDYKVKPVQSWDQYKTAHPEAEGAHKGFKNRLKHGLLGGGLAALSAIAQGGGGSWQDVLARGATAGAIGFAGGAVNPEIADYAKYGTLYKPAEDARYARESEAAKQEYERQVAYRNQQIEGMKAGADIDLKRSQAQKNRLPNYHNLPDSASGYIDEHGEYRPNPGHRLPPPTPPRIASIGGIDHEFDPQTGKWKAMIDPGTGKPMKSTSVLTAGMNNAARAAEGEKNRANRRATAGATQANQSQKIEQEKQQWLAALENAIKSSNGNLDSDAIKNAIQHLKQFPDIETGIGEGGWPYAKRMLPAPTATSGKAFKPEQLNQYIKEEMERTGATEEEVRRFLRGKGYAIQ